VHFKVNPSVQENCIDREKFFKKHATTVPVYKTAVNVGNEQDVGGPVLHAGLQKRKNCFLVCDDWFIHPGVIQIKTCQFHTFQNVVCS